MESKEKIIQMFIDELIEYSLQEHKQKQMSEEEREDRERERILAEQVDFYLKSLPEDKRELIDNYISALRSVNSCDYKALLLYGFREGLKFAKWADE